MNTNHDQHDEALEKILAAMRDAIPPEGMQARITQRLEQHATAPSSPAFRWRDAFANSMRTGEWWRGAITGAAAVLLIAAAVLVTYHQLKTHPNHAATARNSGSDYDASAPVTPVRNPSHSAPANEINTQPCAHPTILQTASTGPIHSIEALKSNSPLRSAVPSHSVSSGPLTAQERELLRLAQSADPRLLATLNSEHQARLEAKNAADFAEFFAPPPRPPVPADIPAVNPATSPEVIPQIEPPSGSPAK